MAGHYHFDCPDYLLYNFHVATMTIKFSLRGTIANVKGFLSRKFLSPIENPTKMFVYWQKWG